MHASLYWNHPSPSPPGADDSLRRPEWQAAFQSHARRVLADLGTKGGLRGRLGTVIAVSALLHSSAWLLWQIPAAPVDEPLMARAVEVALIAAQPVVQPPAARPPVAPQVKPRPKPVVQAPKRPAPRMEQTEREAAPSEPVASTTLAPTRPAEAPAAPFVEADYRAAYLNNPPPKYPMLAKERHWEGLVVLKVQVLADGTSGNVAIEQSSGHEVLDEAAADAARRWRFVAAKRGAETVTSVVLIPIEFKLKT